MVTDPIADFLTRIRNAIKANHRIVEIPSSNLKREMTKILFEKGYILNYKFQVNLIIVILILNDTNMNINRSFVCKF